ncbi:MAG: FUN14 domain-containing protein [Candidatus Binatia bacterium]
MDFSSILSGVGAELGFGGVAGAVVGYTAKKLTKLVALFLGVVFIAIQALVYLQFISVDWPRVEASAQDVWTDAQGVTLAEWAWQVISSNLPFGGAFVAGFGIGFKLG